MKRLTIELALLRGICIAMKWHCWGYTKSLFLCPVSIPNFIKFLLVSTKIYFNLAKQNSKNIFSAKLKICSENKKKASTRIELMTSSLRDWRTANCAKKPLHKLFSSHHG